MIKWFNIFGWICVVVGVLATFGAFAYIADYNTQIESLNAYSEIGQEQPKLTFLVAFIPFFALGFQGCLFFAISEGLEYLRRAANGAENTRHELKVIKGELEKKVV